MRRAGLSEVGELLLGSGADEKVDGGVPVASRNNFLWDRRMSVAHQNRDGDLKVRHLRRFTKYRQAKYRLWENDPLTFAKNASLLNRSKSGNGLCPVVLLVENWLSHVDLILGGKQLPLLCHKQHQQVYSHQIVTDDPTSDQRRGEILLLLLSMERY